MEGAEPVTVTIARTVSPGFEAEFQSWSEQLTRAASTFPGFLGAGHLRPGHAGEPWHVVFRFDSPERLRGWEDSPERAALLAAGSHLVDDENTHRVSGLETWFELPGRTASAPPKWKMFVVSGTAIYLLNLLLSSTYGWALTSWWLPVHAFLISVPVTALMTWLVMPHAARLLRRWLYPPERGVVGPPPADR